jgi:methionine biosynthesis protein MetW
MKDIRDIAYTTDRPDVFKMVPPAAMSILDIGCSNGTLGASLRSAVPGRQVYGIERDASFVTQASTRLNGVMQADINELEWSRAFPGIMFDCVIFSDVLEHLLDPQKHLVEGQKRLLPSGAMVVSLPNIRHISAFYSIFVRGTFPRRDRGIFDTTHLHWFTLRDAKLCLADAGMQVDAATYSLRIGDRGGGLINKIANRLPGPIQGFAPIREFLTYQFCLRAIRRDTHALVDSISP